MSRHHQVLLCALLAAASVCGPANAAGQVTYTGFTVTDVRLAGVLYHNAAVTLRFIGNQADIQPFQTPIQPDGNSGAGFWIKHGSASVEIVSGSKTITANFAAGQIFVSVDQNNAGFGFGSIFGTNPPEPAYPLGIDGTVSVTGLNDLVTPIVQSGRQWSCLSFPVAIPGASGHCGNADAHPLATDHGPFVIYMPYYATDASGKIVDDWEGAINNAIFTIQVP